MGDATFAKLVCDVLLIRTVHPYGWYMQCLFLFYFIFFLAQKVFPDKKECLYGFIFLVSGMIFVLFRGLFKQQLFPFLLGVFVADHASEFRRKAENIWFPGILLALGLMCLYLRQIPLIRESYWAIYNLVHAIQVACLTTGTIFSIQFLCNNWNDSFTDVFLKIGLFSYELYLYHGFVLGYFRRFRMSYSVIAAFFLISVCVAVGMGYGKEKLRKVCTK